MLEINHFLGLIGLSTLVFSGCLYTEQDPYPSFYSSHISASACGCRDLKDLVNLQNETEAAINILDILIAIYQRKEKISGKPYMYTEDRHKKMNYILQVAINKVSDFSANRGRARTDPMDCKIILNMPTKCLREIIQIHEEVHEKKCKAYPGSIQKLYTGKWDWKTQMTMIDFAKEEISGYMTTRTSLPFYIDLAMQKCYENKPKLGFTSMYSAPLPSRAPEEPNLYDILRSIIGR